MENNEKLKEELKKTSNLLSHLKRPAIESIFKSITDISAEFDTNYSLVLSMNKAKESEVIGTFGTKKLQFPDIKRIQIQHIKNSNYKRINRFLSSCVPTTLPLLSVNWNSGEELLKGSLITDSICKASQSVTKEVFLTFAEFNSENVQRIVKSANKSKRLVFWSCKIHTTDDMDFNTDSAITYLSFAYCGHSDVSMKWNKYPKRFENIVAAISKSNLKDSLETININYCNITPDEVKELLKKYNITHIKIVQQEDSPLDD
mmetsp:Transcript_7133/g.6326  ORF Transcript_7133/g.6326 Transcript_7133/m.6326 type:complete len:260 (+) Transcript_7133:859-1638(+)